MKEARGHRYIAIGLLLFALFFGAGNLIFPASMGQQAGTNVWWATLGFCITGVGLPLVGVIALGYSGCPDMRKLADRVHPAYSLFFTIATYLAIGPCFAIPRTGTVSFEIALRPFLPEAASPEIALPVFLAGFFLLSGWLSLRPSKLVDRVGKCLTPMLVLSIGLLVLKSFFPRIGLPQAPTGNYATALSSVTTGVLEGYNTLDALAALVYGTLIIIAVREAGFRTPKGVAREVYKAGLIAGASLATVYVFVARIGADSVSAIGMKETGAPVLAESAKYIFGDVGGALLAAIVLLACLTTAIGLITCCAAFFRGLTGWFTYEVWAVAFCAVSFLIGLFGLKTIITSAIPVLMFLYPLCVALIALALLNDFFAGRQCVYVWTTAPTFVMALISGLETAQVPLGGLREFLAAHVPFYGAGLGWTTFAVAGFCVGLVWKALVPPRPAKRQAERQA